MHPLVDRVDLLLLAPRKAVGSVRTALGSVVSVPTEKIQIADPQFPLWLSHRKDRFRYGTAFEDKPAAWLQHRRDRL
jgi:hypothetical protein